MSSLPNGGLHLSQRKYIIDLLRAKMQYAKGINTPITSDQRLTSYGRALQYTTITRLGIAYNVNCFCHFMQAPLEAHWQAVKRISRYIAGTIDPGLIMQPSSNSMDLEGFCDADWASDLDDRRSTSGFCVFLGSNLIS